MLQATKIIIVFALLLFPCITPMQGHSADSTSFNPTTVAVVPKGAGGVPVGTIIAWPVSKKPEDMDKWLECNGQSVSSAVYPELFALVGGSVPDYRGLFLRGVGGASAALGQAQGDELKSHSHQLSSAPMNTNTLFTPNDTDYGRGSTPSNVQTSSYGGSETRPVNKAVRYLIRAKP